MKFVDEAFVRVEAGNGGNGCLGFRRERCIPRGGPDGGNGGNGGSVYFIADKSVNTLVKFCYQNLLRAQDGQLGMKQLRNGKNGENLVVSVPLGTMIYDKETSELIGDLTKAGDKLCVAYGGRRGLGNAYFKSSTNRSPRKIKFGEDGEVRKLKLELKLLADVGLLGLPNSGKSTLVRMVSNTTSKVADYPFTTLYPCLGVVRLEEYRRFIIADIPGLIKGANKGVGLGVQFLKHLERTRLLLHIVDIAPLDNSDPAQSIRMIINELKQFSKTLSEKPHWLVFNKIDLLPLALMKTRSQEIVKKVNWSGPTYNISAIQSKNIALLCHDLMTFLETSYSQETSYSHMIKI